MPIGIALGTAAVTAGGAVMSASAQKKAASTAAKAGTDSTAANNALARETRAQNAAVFNPYVQTGSAAMSQMNALLGLGGAPASSGGQATPAYSREAAPVDPAAREQWANGALNAMNLGSKGDSWSTLQANLAGQLEGPMGADRMSAYEAYQAQNPQPIAQPMMAPAAAATAATVNAGGVFTPPNYQAVPQAQALQSNIVDERPGPAQALQSGVSYNSLTSALSPYAGPMTSRLDRPVERLTSGMIGTALNPGSLTDFTKSTGYDWRVKQGANALNLGAARQGAFQSGAADKELMNYGQNIASAERQNYIGELNNYVRYNDAFAQNERGYGDQRAQYLDTFDRGERSYGDERGRYMDTFNQNERATRNALAQYGDQFAQGERGYADTRGDYGRQYNMALGQYRDQFAQNERGYMDTRGDYARTYGDNRYDSYLDRVYNQQGLGANAAANLAGVNGTFSAQTQNNNSTAAQIAANAAGARAQATTNMWGGIAKGVGQAAGAFGGYAQAPSYQQYGPPQPYYGVMPPQGNPYGF